MVATRVNAKAILTAIEDAYQIWGVGGLIQKKKTRNKTSHEWLYRGWIGLKKG